MQHHHVFQKDHVRMLSRHLVLHTHEVVINSSAESQLKTTSINSMLVQRLKVTITAQSERCCLTEAKVEVTKQHCLCRWHVELKANKH